jgi:UDP-glucose 4-epimerase
MSAKVRYLVTGGAGFIGSNLVLALTAAGERVRVLDNLVTGRWEHLDGIPAQSLIERMEGDIRDAATVARAAEGVEVILHQAALGSVPRSVETPIESDEVNTGGTVTVLDVARRQGVRRVVFAASSAAYGETPALPKREDMAPLPMSPYAVTKLAGEHYLKVFAQIYGLETLNLRYFNVFGPNQTPDGAYAAAIPRFIDRALSGQPISIFGDGEQTRDFCYIDNTVRANLLAASSPKKLSGEVVNIAGGRRIGLNELCVEIGRAMGQAVAVEHLAPRAGDIRHSLADIGAARELLGYEPLVRWEDGLAPTVAYLRALRAEGPRAASRTLTSARVGSTLTGPLTGLAGAT